MSCASSRAEPSEPFTAVHGRPALLMPIVTQLVTQFGCQTLKWYFGPRSAPPAGSLPDSCSHGV